MFFAYKGLQRCVRDDRYKPIEYVVNGVGTTQLFDILTDAQELNNLVDDANHAERLKRLRAELLRWRDELDDQASPHGKEFWQMYEVGE